ncbi:MAG: electron transport complex protein RnfC, partial [bacterium]|nr:electron transport complex protein RnfC [bacterium]
GLPPEELFECCECGLCDWVCPMRLLPRRINQELKKSLIEAGKRPQKKKAPLNVREMFEYRRVPLERIMGRFDLLRYDVEAPIVTEEFDTDYVRIPLKQHIGIEAKPIVKVGDRVNKYDVIAEVPFDAVGACVHASISGSVTKIDGYIEIKK